MIELFGLALLRPSWLIALPAVALLSYFFARRMTALAGWDRAIDPALLEALERLGRVVPGPGRKNWMPAAVAGLIALALVGPAQENAEGTTFRNLDGLTVVVDVSRSVAEGGHLTEALAAARLIAERAGTRPVALVVYGGDAYLASTYTTDLRALGTTIAVLDGETVPDPGSRPERGLAVARQTLTDASIVAGDVVLVTDGAGIGDAALREAQAIGQAGSRVSTLFVPTASVSPGAGEAPERSVVDALARIGGGKAGDVLQPMEVADYVNLGRATRLGAGDYAALVWRDYGRFLLLLALLPALALFRRGA